MTFDNSKTIIRLRLRVFLATIIFLVYIFLAYFGNVIKFPLLGYSDTVWTLALVIIYLGIAFMPMFLKYKYIYYSDDGNKILMRYYSIGMVKGAKSSVEIPKIDFAGYEMKKYFGGIINAIVLTQKMDRRIARYTPVYISSLSRKETKNILTSLDKYVSKK